ncbi:MAG: hypothetical protein HY751_14020 [Nitrospinae bacterium]|nr:hypothetical protein [Nitrospinota bacterium]
MRSFSHSFLISLCAAALFLGAAAPMDAWAASCCGGGSASSLVMPKFSQGMLDVSLDMEKYDGYWNADGKYLPDPPGSSLNQYRLNLAGAKRLAPRWQAYISLPLVWNDNRYSAVKSDTRGVGDVSLGFWYEAFDNIMCVWKVREIADMKPAVYLGASLTAPTGASAYDDVKSSFDVTGRGFYRLDANLLLEKTIFPWSVSFQYSYGVHLERPINREYGEYVNPYHKKLGDRRLWSVSGGYTHFMESMNSLSAGLSYSDLLESGGTIDGMGDPTSGMKKRSVAGTLALASDDRDWVLKFSLSHTFKQDGFGANFPATDIYTIGVSHVLR